MYLPDTNIYIYALLGKSPYSDLLSQWQKNKTLSISTISIAEYLAKAVDEDKEMFDNLISFVKILPVDIEVARQAGIYRKQFHTKTKKVFLLDCMLAATAKVHNLTLVTVNKADFPMKDIKILEP